MLQTGVVQQLHHNTAEVKIIRSSSCGENCASCGLCPGQTVLVEAINKADAAVGDTVIINMSDKKVLGAAFMVYIVPLIMLIIGYFSGNAVFKNENCAILTGLLMTAVTFAAIIFADRKIKRHYTPHIVNIIPPEKELTA